MSDIEGRPKHIKVESAPTIVSQYTNERDIIAKVILDN